MEITCTDCATVFVRTQPKGRPSTRCPDCQKAFQVERNAAYQRALKERLRVARPDIACEDCGTTYPWPARGKAPKKCDACRFEARREYHNNWRREAYAKQKPSPSVRNRSHLKLKYGLTPEDVERMLEEQGGCAICHTDFSASVKGWHVDHDHATGKVRGILCHHCNVGLGHFRDDQVVMEKALAYLKDASTEGASAA